MFIEHKLLAYIGIIGIQFSKSFTYIKLKFMEFFNIAIARNMINKKNIRN